MPERACFCVSAIWAAFALAAPPAFADEAAPLHIASCRTVVEPHGRGGAAQETIQVSFANDRDAVADIARFSVRNSIGQWQEFTARGSFSKGVIIADRILPAENSTEQHFFSRERTADCALTYVHFTDGTSWMSSP